MEDVLLVDDERPVLDGLLSALDWAEYGFKHIHTAQDAQQALQILQSNKIDLLLSDILMPGMNGLEMLQIVRSRFPNTHCVLLSAHSKFEYAREALKLGVENYLLKPIDIAELRETVYRTVKNIDYTNTISQDLYERNILVRWLHGRISSDELVEHSHYTKLNVLLRRYRVLYVQSAQQLGRLMDRICGQLRLSYATHSLMLDESNGFIVVGGREVSDQTIYEMIHDLLAQWPEALVVCGSQAAGNSEVVQSRADAVHAATYADLAGRKGWISYDAIDWSVLTLQEIAGLERIVHQDVSGKAAAEWSAALVSRFSSAQLQTVYAQTCLALNRIVNAQEAPAAQSITFASFGSLNTHEHAVQMLTDAVMKVSQTFRQGVSHLSPITRRVVNYVAENLTSTISIKKFAEQTHMNATYIGRLFRDEMGMYFSDYVCLIRMNKAKTLLETTSLSVGEIARQVGIYDVSYFTQCFKKQERISPMKYRQQWENQRAL